MANVAVVIFVTAGVLGTIIAATILRGWVLSILWAWFAVPFGLPQLGLAQAIGVALLIGMLTRDPTPTGKGEDAWRGIAVAFLTPFFCLFAGWIIKSFW